MNRKEEKSIHAIHDALQTLIKQKDYADITISDLIRTSGVSRSTFYAHFKSKDDVLQNVCHAIFHHVFSASLKPEAHHDFSHSLAFDYEHMLTHLFCHFQEEKELIRAVLLSKYAPIFSEKFREEFRPIDSSFSSLHPPENIPLTLEIEKTTEDFLLTLNYWISQDFSQSPQEIGTIYFALIQ